MELRDTLKLSEPFVSFPDDVLDEIGKAAELIPYMKGEVVYNVGEKAEAIYIILSGRVKRTVRPPIAMITQEKIHRPGEVVGWISLFQDQPYGLQTWVSRIACVEDSVVIKVDSKKFEAILNSKKDICASLRARQAQIIADSIKMSGSAVTFTRRGHKKVPRFVSYSQVDRLLANRDTKVLH